MDIITYALSKSYSNRNRLTQVNSYDDLPEKGGIGALYLTKDTGQTYYWDESTEGYIAVGTAGRSGVYTTSTSLPTTLGQTIDINKTDLVEVIAPTVAYSEGSEVIGINAIQGLIISSQSTKVTVKTVMDANVESFKQVASEDELPAIGQENTLYAIKDTNEFKAWSSADADYRSLPNIPLSRDITVKCEQGKYAVGTVIPKGTSLEEIVINMLLKTNYPTLTNPSATLEGTGDKLAECGQTINATFTATFDRGSINPAYGTSGYRAGAATGYKLNGGNEQAENTFTRTVSDTNKGPFYATVYYAQGEQPLDDEGGNYETPLAAGSLTTNQIYYEFVNALYANTADISNVAKLNLISKGSGSYVFEFPAQSIEHPEIFEVPSDWNITAIEMLNTINNQWENCASEFTTSSTTHQNAGGETVNYVRYTDNRACAAGDRKVRIQFN